MTLRARVAAAFLVLAAAGRTLAADAPASSSASPEGLALARLGRLKALAGTWSGKASHRAGDAADAKVEWSVTGGGTAVVERLFPGTPHEMMTVYVVDGRDLVLTHYCAAGNQPTMKARPEGGTDLIVFDFVSGGNMRPTDAHMHAAVITFLPDGGLRTDWSSFKNGGVSDTVTFELRRER